MTALADASVGAPVSAPGTVCSDARRSSPGAKARASARITARSSASGTIDTAKRAPATSSGSIARSFLTAMVRPGGLKLACTDASADGGRGHGGMRCMETAAMGCIEAAGKAGSGEQSAAESTLNLEGLCRTRRTTTQRIPTADTRRASQSLTLAGMFDPKPLFSILQSGPPKIHILAPLS
eukprot:347701-Chlamydomonas_euryale.AAC.21